MVSTDAARTAVGILGNVTALFLFLSPMPTFITIWNKGSVEQYSPTPYLATFINCLVWVLYGLPIVTPHSLLVMTINGAGVFIEIVYLTLFIIFSDAKMRTRVILIALGEMLVIGLLAALTLTLVHSRPERALIIGIIAVIFNVVMYAAPLSIMKMVIKTKSVEYMPFFLSLTSFANGACWVAYALIRFDPFIAVPNGIGTLFSVVQLILYATYYKSTQRQLAERRDGGEVELGLSETQHNRDATQPTQNGSQEPGVIGLNVKC